MMFDVVLENLKFKKKKKHGLPVNRVNNSIFFLKNVRYISNIRSMCTMFLVLPYWTGLISRFGQNLRFHNK